MSLRSWIREEWRLWRYMRRLRQIAKTGSIISKAPETFEGFQKGDVIKVSGMVGQNAPGNGVHVVEGVNETQLFVRKLDGLRYWWACAKGWWRRNVWKA